MSHLKYLDDLVREYLLFRGFTITLKSFDGELKVDKDRGFRVDRIVDQFIVFINCYDLVSLRELWSHFDQKIFSKLEHDYAQGIKKLESSLLKFYLVNAASNGKTDKIIEFFSKMTPELQGLPEWKDWFMLPYVKNSEEHPTFSVHFTKQWQDTFLVSLHNFLAIIYQVMPQPALSSYEEEASKLRRLQEENDSLKHKLATLTQCSNVVPEAVPPIDIMDDFYIIAQEVPSTGEGHTKSLKSLIRTIGGGMPTSPVLGRKPTSQDENYGAEKLHPGKRQISQGGWTKHSGVDSVPKRSLSLDSRSRRCGRDSSVEKIEKKTSKEENFLLLSQEKMTEHKNPVTQSKFNASGNLVASCDTDGTLVIWSPGPKTVRVSSKIHFKGERLLSLGWFAKNERYLVTGSYGGVLRLHDTKDNRLVWVTGYSDIGANLANSKILSLSCSPTESNVAFSIVNQQTKNSPVYLFDVTTKKLEHSFDLGKGVHANSCQFNHNGSLVIAGCSDGSVRTLDLRNGDCVCTWNTNKTSPVTTIQLSPDHNLCYSLGFDHKLYTHDLAHSSELLRSIQLPPCKRSLLHGTQSFALHLTGEHVLTACGNHGAIIYHMKSNQVEQVLQLGDHNNMLTVCDWSTANQCTTALSGSVDGLIKISTILTP